MNRPSNDNDLQLSATGHILRDYVDLLNQHGLEHPDVLAFEAKHVDDEHVTRLLNAAKNAYKLHLKWQRQGQSVQATQPVVRKPASFLTVGNFILMVICLGNATIMGKMQWDSIVNHVPTTHTQAIGTSLMLFVWGFLFSFLLRRTR